MKRLDAGSSIGQADEDGNLELPAMSPRWETILANVLDGRQMRPVQRQALLRHRILETRQHVVVAAPTNSGKSLLGHLLLLEAVLMGRRAVLLEPLRALAQEQADSLREMLARLSPSVFDKPPSVRVCTGDYRLESERPSDGPTDHGELIVATPERLDALLRNPANDSWVSSIGALVVDEAHLLGVPRRGPTLELLIASMLAAPAPPRLTLLSATVGAPERLREWLAPCTLVASTARSPLERQVWGVEATAEVDSLLANELNDVLAVRGNAALVFVNRRAAAAALARKLSLALGCDVEAYHSGMSAAHRTAVRQRFHAGAVRCLVATTALALGVNLPATHVIVRDTSFFGTGSLRVDELLQILGRAGRGDRAGFGSVIVRPSDDWDAEELARSLRDEKLPPLRSAFEFEVTRHGRDQGGEAECAAATLVATCIGRAGEGGATKETLGHLLGNTLGAQSLVPRIDSASHWLSDPARALAFRAEDGRFHLTVLGAKGLRSMLPLPYLSGFGQLIRDLISLDRSGRLLGRWSSLDHLFVIALASGRGWKPRRFSDDLVNRVDSWLETRPVGEKSLLFSEWVAGTDLTSKADELLGSLGLPIPIGPRGHVAAARRAGYVAMFASILLVERAQGLTTDDLERRWGVPNIDGSDESWRDAAIWMLSGHAAVCDVRAYYHHLRENCGATMEQVQTVKRALRTMRDEAYDAMERLKYCSPLGPLMRGVRDMLRESKEPSVGIGTIRGLEAAGVSTIQQVAQMDVDELVATGVQRRFAKQLRSYIRRRLR